MVLFWAGSREAITGDLDRDGDVDLDDFFLFADNFGKKGQDVFLECGPKVATGFLPNLAYIRIGPYVAYKNRDNDIDLDGIVPQLSFSDVNDERIYFTREDSYSSKV